MIPTLSVQQRVVRAALSTFNVAVSVVHFLILLSIAQNGIKIYKKMKSFVFLASMVPLGIVELSFLIFIYSYYPRFADPRTLTRKVMGVTGVQALIFSAIVVIGLLVYAPYARVAGISSFALLTTLDWIQFGAGLAAGIALLAASSRLSRARGTSEA